MLGIEFSVQPVVISVLVLAHFSPSFSATDFAQKVVLVHDSQNRLWILSDSFTVQPEFHSAIAVCLFTRFLLCTMPMDDCIFETRLHFLSMDRIKSRSSSFSIFSRLISYACSAAMSLGWASFRGLPFGCSLIPAASFRCCLLNRNTQFLMHFLSTHNFWAISRFVLPSRFNSKISFPYTSIFTYFLGIAKPPRVVLLSYTRRPFVYCLLFTDLFNHPKRKGFFFLKRGRMINDTEKMSGWSEKLLVGSDELLCVYRILLKAAENWLNSTAVLSIMRNKESLFKA